MIVKNIFNNKIDGKLFTPEVFKNEILIYPLGIDAAIDDDEIWVSSISNNIDIFLEKGISVFIYNIKGIVGKKNGFNNKEIDRFKSIDYYRPQIVEGSIIEVVGILEKLIGGKNKINFSLLGHSFGNCPVMTSSNKLKSKIKNVFLSSWFPFDAVSLNLEWFSVWTKQMSLYDVSSKKRVNWLFDIFKYFDNNSSFFAFGENKKYYIFQPSNDDYFEYDKISKWFNNKENVKIFNVKNANHTLNTFDKVGGIYNDENWVFVMKMISKIISKTELRSSHEN